jgi:hypothetical protein
MKKNDQRRHEKRPRQLAEHELVEVGGGISTKEPTKLEIPNLKVSFG